jgi:2-oxoglutarate ferredoxin oxidoreductase subunit beta
MGLSHFGHAARRNIGLVDLVQYNRVYGLTRGQYSPTSDQGMRTPTSPYGAIERPVSPLAMAITMGATFVARGYAAELRYLVRLVGEALQHRGYALIDVLQPCVTFNRPSSCDFYNPHAYKLGDVEHDVSDKVGAWQRAFEWGERIPIGIFYRTEDVRTYKEQVLALQTSPATSRLKHRLRPAQVEELLAEVM